jgi:hypothetical protein
MNELQNLDVLLEEMFDTFEPDRIFGHLQKCYFNGLWVQCTYDVRYQPTYRWFITTRHSKSDKSIRPSPPSGYRTWLQIFADTAGYYVYVYYPKYVKKGQQIKVIYDGSFFRGFVNWVHGEEGLFQDSIWPFLALEHYFDGSDQRIEDWVDRRVMYQHDRMIQLVNENKSLKSPYIYG